jgi:phage nucleotide-binding protein
MALIKKSTEIALPTTVKMMIYGQAGTGKTSLALSAPKPLLLDFDNGVKRVNINHLNGVDIVQVTSWKEIQQLINQEAASLAPYQSIVVDTVGKMMDFIIAYKVGTRQPQLREWGNINQEFTWFTRALSSLNKHIIFIAHRDTRKEGDATVFIPALREKNYNAIVTDLDLLGYLEMKSERGIQQRTITFEPTDRNDGKNTCNLPATMNLPITVDRNGNTVGNNDFIQKEIISRYADMLAQKVKLQAEYNELMTDLAGQIDAITDVDGVNAFIKVMQSVKHVGSSKEKTWALLCVKAQSLQLTYDNKKKQFCNNANAE